MMDQLIDKLNNYQHEVKIFSIVFLFLLCTVLIIFAKKDNWKFDVRKLVFVSVFSALSVALYYIKIPFPVFSFLEIQISNVPSLIIGFLLGPFYGMLTVCIRTIIKVWSSETVFVGELTDLIIGLFVVGVSSLIYEKNKTKKSAGISLIVAAIIWTLISILLNWLVIIPVYSQVMFGTSGGVAGIIESFGLAERFPNITEANFMKYYLLVGVLPFNILLSALSSAITFLIYKRISILYHKK